MPLALPPWLRESLVDPSSHEHTLSDGARAPRTLHGRVTAAAVHKCPSQVPSRVPCSQVLVL